jgi:hypothetical protein
MVGRLKAVSIFSKLFSFATAAAATSLLLISASTFWRFTIDKNAKCGI